MERKQIIDKIIPIVYKNEKCGFTIIDDWFYTTTSNCFCVDIGNMRIDCKAIEVNDLHLTLFKQLPLGEVERFMFPLSAIMKFTIRMVGD